MMIPVPASPLSGRRAQAARNDELILTAARSVFIDDPGAPITAVAKRAGVGISALYSRYGSKEELLRTLCHQGLKTYVEQTEEALADDRDPWLVFESYMRGLVAADTSSLTLALAGRFTPTDEMTALAERANRLSARLFERFAAVLRPGVEVHDLSLVFELVAAIKLGDAARNAQLRSRYLTAILDGLRAENREPLPGPAPNWQDIYARWSPRLMT
jgi:AcrR family transcriptional regulator